jgi:hypothetical protein
MVRGVVVYVCVFVSMQNLLLSFVWKQNNNTNFIGIDFPHFPCLEKRGRIIRIIFYLSIDSVKVLMKTVVMVTAVETKCRIS